MECQLYKKFERRTFLRLCFDEVAHPSDDMFVAAGGRGYVISN